ncbi:hypothetical protein [Paenimyroides ceti]
MIVIIGLNYLVCFSCDIGICSGVIAKKIGMVSGLFLVLLLVWVDWVLQF